MGVRIIDKRANFDRIIKSLVKKGNNPAVKIGFVGDVKQHKSEEKSSNTKPLNIVEVAAVNEFGVKAAGKNGGATIPERSFMRSTFDEKTREWLKVSAKFINKILEGRGDILQMLNRLGAQAETDIKNKVVNLKKPPNAASTVAGKKSSNPLIDTGQMLQSIRYAIIKRVFGK